MFNAMRISTESTENKGNKKDDNEWKYVLYYNIFLVVICLIILLMHYRK